MDLSLINLIFQNNRIHVQNYVWDYSTNSKYHPNPNGDVFIASRRIKIPLQISKLKTTLLNVIDDISSEPLLRDAVQITHVIIPTIPDWAFQELSEITGVILFRGIELTPASAPNGTTAMAY